MKWKITKIGWKPCNYEDKALKYYCNKKCDNDDPYFAKELKPLQRFECSLNGAQKDTDSLVKEIFDNSKKYSEDIIKIIESLCKK